LSAQETQPETVGFRLSPQQARVLAAGHVGPAVQCGARFRGPVTEAAVRAALEELITRHEVLRTTFPGAAGMLERTQAIHDRLSPAWSSDRTAANGSALDDASPATILSHEAETGFDLDHGPLIRGLLMPSGEDRALVVLTAHPACADATSLLVILGELAQILAGRGESAEPVQYADYAEWRHELITGEDPAASDGRAFWTEQAEMRTPPPSIMFATPQTRSGRSASVPVELEDAEAAALRNAARAAGVDPSVFLEACWHALIARVTGVTELVLPGWCDGRAQPDLEQAVGAYAQPVPVRSRFEDRTAFAEVLDQVERSRADGAQWQDFASGEDLGVTGAAGAAGFIHFELEDTVAPGLDLVALNPACDVPLLLAARSEADRLSAELWYDPTAHPHQDVVELARCFRTLLTSAVSDPDRPVARLELIDAAERASLLAVAAGPAPSGDAAIRVHALFERQAQRTPERPAVRGATGELSYAELGAAANRLAHLLRDAGVSRGVRVGLCLERTPHLLVALLGILKSGGVYVPLNYEHPQARLAHQLAEAEARVLVTEQPLLDRLPPFPGEIICLDRDASRIAGFSERDPDPVSEPGDLAYVMYTSGSTGLPKGVAVTHGNLANYATHIAARLDGDDAATPLRYGVVSAISTDLGNTSIFPPLTSGGCVRLISVEASMNGSDFAAELTDGPLDVLKITPSHLRALLAADEAGAVLPQSRLVVGGEALSWDLVAQIRSLSPSCRILNHYGPTETTVGCCAYEVGPQRDDAATVPIGAPLAGARAYVLDRHLGLVPAGVPGELCIAGAGVANGYVGARSDGDEVFVSDPFGEGSARMYRTGDRARVLRDGAIEFLGRVDDQVKIRGFRIEPGEIEAMLLRHPSIRQAAVVPEDDGRGDHRLVAYIAASSDPTVEDLQSFLAESLPDYMVPASFATLDALPFTPSGKIDRQALSGIAAVETRRDAAFVAPRDPLEEEIAGIWAELLGTDRVGVHDDFFALGGHSLLATQAIMRIRRLHGDIPLRALLAAPTVATLAEVVRSASLGS
jgi:amino acid adenylation domain-containing protein